jgi:hypothetical protein
VITDNINKQLEGDLKHVAVADPCREVAIVNDKMWY